MHVYFYYPSLLNKEGLCSLKLIAMLVKWLVTETSSIVLVNWHLKVCDKEFCGRYFCAIVDILSNDGLEVSLLNKTV